MLAINEKEKKKKEDYLMSIQANINLARIVKSLGIQKKFIAGKLQVTPSTVSRHLSGTLQLTYKQIMQYSNVLNVHPNSIIGVPDIPIIGYADRHDEIKFRRENEPRKYLMPPPNFLVNAPSVSAIVRQVEHGFQWKQGTLFLVEPDNIRNRVFNEEETLQEMCILECKAGDESIVTVGIPILVDGQYQVLKPNNPADGITKANIRWATLIKASIYKAFDNGWTIIEKEN